MLLSIQDLVELYKPMYQTMHFSYRDHRQLQKKEFPRINSNPLVLDCQQFPPNINADHYIKKILKKTLLHLL